MWADKKHGEKLVEEHFFLFHSAPFNGKSFNLFCCNMSDLISVKEQDKTEKSIFYGVKDIFIAEKYTWNCYMRVEEDVRGFVEI